MLTIFSILSFFLLFFLFLKDHIRIIMMSMVRNIKIYSCVIKINSFFFSFFLSLFSFYFLFIGYIPCQIDVFIYKLEMKLIRKGKVVKGCRRGMKRVGEVMFEKEISCASISCRKKNSYIPIALSK